MPTLITTHRLTRATVGLLDNIAAEVFDQEVDSERLATCLESPDHLTVVAVCGNQVVGQIAAYVHHHPDQPSDIYVDNLGVAPAFQRRGIALRLIDEVFGWGKALGCEQAWILTDPDNNAARTLYEKRGGAAKQVMLFPYDL